MKQMSEFVHVRDLSVFHDEERDHLDPDRLAICLLGFDHINVSNRIAVDNKRFDRRAAPAQRLLQRASLIYETSEVEPLPIGVLDIVRRE